MILADSVADQRDRGSRTSETLSVRPVVTIPVLLVNANWYNFVFIVPLINLTLVVIFVYYNGSFTPGNAGTAQENEFRPYDSKAR